MNTYVPPERYSGNSRSIGITNQNIATRKQYQNKPRLTMNEFVAAKFNKPNYPEQNLKKILKKLSYRNVRKLYEKKKPFADPYFYEIHNREDIFRKTKRERNAAIQEFLSLEQKIRNSNVPNKNIYLSLIEAYKQAKINFNEATRKLNLYNTVRKKYKTNPNNKTVNTNLKPIAGNKYKESTLFSNRRGRLNSIFRSLDTRFPQNQYNRQANLERVFRYENIVTNLANVKKHLGIA